MGGINQEKLLASKGFLPVKLNTGKLLNPKNAFKKVVAVESSLSRLFEN
jgi:hypothetical protein